MDISKDYILMCKKTKEIQKLRKKIDLSNWKLDDVFHEEHPEINSKDKSGLDWTYIYCQIMGTESFNRYPYIWLPRIDQLIELLKGSLIDKIKLFNLIFIQPILKINEMGEMSQEDIANLKLEWEKVCKQTNPIIISSDLDVEVVWMGVNPLKSMEQCWLMLVMKEKYNKFWNLKNKNWEIIKN